MLALVVAAPAEAPAHLGAPFQIRAPRILRLPIVRQIVV
jgi:hypothetical protein